jgi:hypothetical protein
MGDVRHLRASKGCRPQLLRLLLTYRFVTTSLAASVLCATLAQAEEREKSAAVIELGAGAESQIVDGEFSSGPYVALEFEAVKGWLEIEIGVSPQFGSHQTDLASEFILKAPVFQMDKLEIMFGVGPQWEYHVAGGELRNSVGAEAQLELEYWPSTDRKFGWFVEYQYGRAFTSDRAQSFGVQFGLLVPIR